MSLPVPGLLRRGAAPLLLVLLATLSSIAADTQPPLEYRVKAAFLFNFARFVEWPEEPAASAPQPLTICVIGEDPFGEALDQLVQGEVVGARRIAVQRHPTPPQSHCDVAYIAKQPRENPDRR